MRILALLLVLLAALPACAQAAGAPPPSCDQPTPASGRTSLPFSIEVNPSTNWQPRGGTVIVAVGGSTDALKNLSFVACFGWGTAGPGDYWTADNLKNTFTQVAFVAIRPQSDPNAVNPREVDLGVTVPDLPPERRSLIGRWQGSERLTALGTVPVADMRLIAYTDSGVAFDVVRRVGVTSVTVALVSTLALVVVAMMALHALAGGQLGALRSVRRLGPAVKAALSFRWVLRLVRGGDGRASLSAFQVLLWSLVVAAGSAYVMILSGQLINITPGTLVLLGIAGGAGLIAAYQTPPTKGTPTATPAWGDLVTVDGGSMPDVTRLQMLLFTVVTAVFVMMKVLTTYIIPDIPQGYLLLMGISNGVYVGAKFTSPPNKPPGGAGTT